jgi:hypothetical protein
VDTAHLIGGSASGNLPFLPLHPMCSTVSVGLNIKNNDSDRVEKAITEAFRWQVNSRLLKQGISASNIFAARSALKFMTLEEYAATVSPEQFKLETANEFWRE